MRKVLLVCLAALTCACGGSSASPTSPGGTGGSPSGQAGRITGRITDTLSGSAVAGATVSVQGQAPVTSAADGTWRVDIAASALARLTVAVSAPGFLSRTAVVNWQPEGSSNQNVDLVPLREPFSLDFFREIIRNALDGAGLPYESVHRLTTNPNFYILTTNPKTGAPITQAELDQIIVNIKDTVGQMTGGTLSTGTIEWGTEARNPRTDWINVYFQYDPKSEYCGQSGIGLNPGWVVLNYDRCARSCGAIPPELVGHEVGHALGFYHTEKGVMKASGFAQCSGVNFSDAERASATIAYHRPNGNSDIDTDPDPSTLSVLSASSAPVARCTAK
jgi:hypothetical protein